MTGRDLCWRAGGAALYVAGCVAALLSAEGSPWVTVQFLAVIAGLVLLVNGKRVAVALRAELRGHKGTAQAVHAARRRRR